jgi:5-methylcytosine-specific restriction endonuclease McrA
MKKRKLLKMRQSLKNDVPEEWRIRAKAGLCPVCAKTKDQWAKGARVFCSKKCREEYASKYCYWSDIRYKILERDKNTCKKCGISDEKYRKKCDEIKNEALKKWAEENQDIIKTMRDERLVRLDRRFQEEYEQIMNDMWMADHCLTWEAQHRLTKLPQEPKMEVDHTIPVFKGGDMWDEKNMQTLCDKCHRKKTTKELKKGD